MKIETLPIAGLAKIIPARLGDHRGYFSEVFKDGWFRQNVLDTTFVQDVGFHAELSRLGA